MSPHNRLRDALIDRECVTRWNPADWGLAIRQARSANLLAALGARFEGASEALRVPESAKEHFSAVRHVIAQRNAAVRWEAGKIRDALARSGLKPIYLKGVAYVVAGLPLAGHRNFSDVDLMVPHNQIAQAELSLTVAGWLPTNRDAYDQRYYRKWMHEIPPLQHIRRGTTLDLHHAISPPTAKYRARTSCLFDAQVAASEVEGVSVLSPADMILHAATHLFAEGEVESGLRNLVDISELLQHFQGQPGFDAQLAARAFEIGLSRPVYYALRYLDRILRQPALETLTSALEPARPGGVALALMDGIYDQVFQGHHPSVWASGADWKRTALYLRGHWLRMPLHLLAPHLAMKSFRAYRAPVDANPQPKETVQL
ncbi:MAG TPA: nucleotidyltransferase family protein [Burkholderiaceae bacterium]|nr:nucleotidyltransferase family protein [Burkholderiaceae bacterium]